MNGLEFLDAITEDVHKQIADTLCRLPSPKSRWRDKARTTIIRALRGFRPMGAFPVRDEGIPGEIATASQRIHDAYGPVFGERKMAPYKAWLEETKLLRDVAQHICVAWTDEMTHLIAVARDEELQNGKTKMLDTLLAQIDYPILFTKCGTCGAHSNHECYDMDRIAETSPKGLTPTERSAWYSQKVPHDTRLPLSRPITQRADADLPLFGAGAG